MVPFAVKIGDFGLARSVNVSEELTAGVGTRRYMAPEVICGTTFGTRSNLYSLGVMFQEDLELAGACVEVSNNAQQLAPVKSTQE